jgi:hypothetical protein
VPTVTRWIPILVNLLGFKACWLALVSTEPEGLLWVAVAGAAVWLCVHLSRSPFPAREAMLILCGAILGTGWDIVSVNAGIIVPDSSHSPTPAFLARFFALWVTFGTTIRVSFSWCWRSLWLAALLGAIGGPLSYWFGSKAGAIDFPADPLPGLAAIGVQYAVLFPVWLYAARQTFTMQAPP